MEIEEPQVCKHCNGSMDRWHWVRYAKIGAWEESNGIACPNCKKLPNGEFEKEVKIDLSGIFISVDRKMKAHDRDLHSRVIADDGETVLKGEKGLTYMKEKAKSTPGYANRLRDYYKL